MTSKMIPKGNVSGWSPYVKMYDPLKAGSIDGTDLIPHDNAVVRAMGAKYKPPGEETVCSNPSLTLFVGRLNLRTSERQLTEEFSKYGSVKSCRLVQDIVTGISRGYGFVEFKKETDAQKAWKSAHGSIFHERQILVEWEFSRTMPGWIPRRLGGGLGGKRESGQLRFGGRDRPFKKPFILPPEENVLDITAESTHSQQLPDNDKIKEGFNKGMENDYESSFKYGTETRQHYLKNSFGDRRIKNKTYLERKYSDQAHYEEDGRKHRVDSDCKFSDHHYYDQHSRKYERGHEDDYGEPSYYGESKRSSRRYWEPRSSDHEEDRRKSNRHFDDDYISGKEEYKTHFEDHLSGQSGEKRSFKSRKEDSKRKSNSHFDNDYFSGKEEYNNHFEDHFSGQSYEKRSFKSRSEDSKRKHKDQRNFETYYSSPHPSYHFDEEGSHQDKEEMKRSQFVKEFKGRDFESTVSKKEDKCDSNKTQHYELIRKRKRDCSSDSSSSQKSAKRKHKKSKSKKKKHRGDSREEDLSIVTSKAHKKKRKKKKEKKSRRKSSSSEETD